MSKLNWSQYPNFQPHEFKDGGAPMAPEFMYKLQKARDICKDLCYRNGYSETAFIITSGSRSKSKNQQVGGKPDSTHLYGRACDIAAVSSRTRFLIVKSLILAGFTRIGLSRDEGFIHVDDGEELCEIAKDANVLWLYG